MPTSIALLFYVPVGLLFYFEARWFFRRFAGRCEYRERRAARLWGLFGGLLIPLIYCFGFIEGGFQEGLEGQLQRRFLWLPYAGLPFRYFRPW
jgi:hypothetical protein